MRDWLQRVWYGGARSGVILVPLSWLFRLLVALRRTLYRMHLLPSYAAGRPVIVVGNITVGGTGKTPLTLWVAARLADWGWRVGVVSRGYGGSAATPRLVRADDDPAEVGDEPLLMARAGALVAVGVDRVRAARLLVEQGCDVIVADDGLQHLRLRREVEIAVVDGGRGLGNGRLLPAGPLREPASRLKAVDAVVVNGATPRLAEIGMQIVARDVVALASQPQSRPLGHFAGQRVHAVAGIGNPARFFALLREHGLTVVEHPLPDHAVIAAGDIRFDDTLPVLMTEKDAVKCRGIVDQRHWAVRVRADIREVDAARFDGIVLSAIGLRSRHERPPGRAHGPAAG